ncbi:beta-L-arabinofuranosidase domain-containing protein [Paenibacillus ferrarius]|uniref:beta-L-arabinofuranosidase domain-containing protein n=1 Tax=Paenibacillus ferrarius TaxID=1469647 RepID=UPI003D2671B8
MYQNFNLDAVRLTDNDFAARRELAKKYVMNFDVDRLMHTFKLNAGMPSLALPLGGWEDVTCGLRGHFVGHFLSACAKFACADQDKVLESKANAIVNMMELCAKPNGYLSAFEEEKLDILEFEEDRNVWAPYYTLHKIMQGLVDCHMYLGNIKSLNLAVNLATYIYERFKKLSFWKIDGILRCTKVNPVNEFGGIGDVLYTLYDLTKLEHILALANMFDRDYFLARLAEGKDVLDNLHANTHLPMIIAAMHRYNISGEMQYKKAAIHFYDYVMGRTFANGNSSSKATAFIKGGVSEKSEHWGCYGELGDALTGGESESCCAHNTERILQQLVEWSGSVHYLNHLESLKYNAILNSASSKTGLSQYHQPLGTNVRKKFSGEYDSFWCCTASGIEAMSEIQKNIWFKNEDSIVLNAYISSTVTWQEKNMTITQITEYPDNLVSVLEFRVSEPTACTVLLKEDTVQSIRINSTPIELEKESGFIVIQRVFYDQDTIEIEIDAQLSVVPLKGSQEMAAVRYGSILLAQVGHSKLLEGISNENINQRMIRVNQPQLAFTGRDDEHNEVRLIPLFRVEDETYTVYTNVMRHSEETNTFVFAQSGSSAYE